jgi:hypothetical protein
MSTLPIGKGQALQACTWLKSNFGDEIRAAVFAPFTIDHVCAIACQETAYFWLKFVGKLTPAEVLGRCVLDGSGDVEGSSRSAFPRNTAAFIERCGKDFADMLVVEGNKTRALRGMKPWGKVYKGYGIFQYDLQFVIEDEVFFRERQWYDARKVVDRCMMELRRTYARHGDVKEAIRAYNGSGQRARQYAENVMQFLEWSKETT